tara:strand:- start:5668 stop:5958 length:291 start_codon:yes stop_codon:yes gene_type:complete
LTGPKTAYLKSKAFIFELGLSLDKGRRKYHFKQWQEQHIPITGDLLVFIAYTFLSFVFNGLWVLKKRALTPPLIISNSGHFMSAFIDIIFDQINLI